MRNFANSRKLPEVFLKAKVAVRVLELLFPDAGGGGSRPFSNQPEMSWTPRCRQAKAWWCTNVWASPSTGAGPVSSKRIFFCWVICGVPHFGGDPVSLPQASLRFRIFFLSPLRCLSPSPADIFHPAARCVCFGAHTDTLSKWGARRSGWPKL